MPLRSDLIPRLRTPVLVTEGPEVGMVEALPHHDKFGSRSHVHRVGKKRVNSHDTRIEY